MKHSKYTLVAALAVLPLGLVGCASNDRRADRDEQHRGDYIVAAPQTNDQTYVAGSSARANSFSTGQRSQDVSTAARLPGSVRGTVQSRFPGALILDVREGSADEWVVYIQSDNVIRELHVRASDGLVLSSDNSLSTQAAIDALPVGAKTVAMSRQPGGVIYNVEQVGDTEPATYRVYTLSGGEQYFVDAGANGMMLAEGRATDASRAVYATSPMNSQGNRVQAASVDQERNTEWRETNGDQPSLEVRKSQADRDDRWDRDRDDDSDRDDRNQRDRDDRHDPD